MKMCSIKSLGKEQTCTREKQQKKWQTRNEIHNFTSKKFIKLSLCVVLRVMAGVCAAVSEIEQISLVSFVLEQ